jgi:undecaprenyl pyrophosphate synthase
MCQYADFAFIEKLFPDVTLADVVACIDGFHAGERHFGA